MCETKGWEGCGASGAALPGVRQLWCRVHSMASAVHAVCVACTCGIWLCCVWHPLRLVAGDCCLLLLLTTKPQVLVEALCDAWPYL